MEGNVLTKGRAIINIYKLEGVSIKQRSLVINSNELIYKALCLCSRLGSNQGPPDYESGATNQLSYRSETGAKIQTCLIFHNRFLKKS